MALGTAIGVVFTPCHRWPVKVDPNISCRLGRGLWHAGAGRHGLTHGAEALEAVEQTGARWYEAETYRIKVTLLLHQAVPDAAQAETCFQQALDIARHQEAKAWELRAAISLARLWQSQGKRQEAYDLLTPVYEWFYRGV
jgi:predicted ATPase